MSTSYFIFQSEPTLGKSHAGDYCSSVSPNYELRSVDFRSKSVRFFNEETVDFSRMLDVEGGLIELPPALHPSKGSTHVLQIGQNWHYLWADYGDLLLTEVTKNIPLASVFE